ncbi:DUF2501 domain-containing protein [Comamonas humi]
MKKLALSLLLGATVLGAQASGLSDTLRDKASQFGGSSGSAEGSSVLGSLGGGASALGLGGLTGSGTASNAAGVLSYCMKNNYLNPDKAAQMKDQLLGKIGMGPKEEPKDAGYQNGLGGLVTGSNGQSFSLDKVKSSLKEKACDLVLDNAKSLL